MYRSMIDEGCKMRVRCSKLGLFLCMWIVSINLHTKAQVQDNVLTPIVSQQDLLASSKRTVRPTLYYNHYGTPQRRNVRKKKRYTFAQDNIGFFMPVYSDSWFKADGMSIASLHVLAVGDLVSYRPKVTFANEVFKIARLSVGGRMFYSDGYKSIFYIGITPFTSRDLRSQNLHLTSFTGAAIYSRTVSPTFAYRLGISNSYTYGVLLPLPVAGIRVGALDKVHLSVQFPRNIELDIPAGKNTMISLFARSMGGLYNVSMEDTLISTSIKRARLARFEIVNGAQANFRISDHFSLYIGSGIASRRRVNFSYKEKGVQKWQYSRHRVPASLFFTFGLSIRFGKAKQVYNDAQMYNMFELNTINNAGDKDTGTYDNDVPADPKKYNIEKINKVKYKDVEDLITDEY